MIPDEPTPARPWSPELLVAAACLAVAMLLALPPVLGLSVAAIVFVVSFATGAIAGLGYHLALHRTLAPLEPGWWWAPTRLHARLGEHERRRVMPWFVVGAAGFLGSLLGCAAFVSALLRL